MKACEALEVLKAGLRVVAFQPGSSMAREMFQLSTPDVVEIFEPTISEQPAAVMSPKEFLQSYSDATFVEYTIK